MSETTCAKKSTTQTKWTQPFSARNKAREMELPELDLSPITVKGPGSSHPLNSQLTRPVSVGLPQVTAMSFIQ